MMNLSDQECEMPLLLLFFLDFSCYVFFEATSFYHKPQTLFGFFVLFVKEEWVWSGSHRGLPAWLCAKSIECSAGPHADAMYVFQKILDCVQLCSISNLTGLMCSATN